MWASQHTKEPCKTDYQTNYQWRYPPVGYGVSEPKTYHDDSTVEKVQIVEQNHEVIKPEPTLQLGSPTQQYESERSELPTEGEGENSKIDSLASDTWDDDKNVDIPEEATADSTLLPATTTLMKRKEDVMDKGTMTSRSSGVISIEGNYDERPDIGVKCDEIEQVRGTHVMREGLTLP